MLSYSQNSATIFHLARECAWMIGMREYYMSRRRVCQRLETGYPEQLRVRGRNIHIDLNGMHSAKYIDI